ncbi:MAG: helix-turn-helix transcriptional regulator [Lawsonibacter sp.]|nr:helix-turn-helix transcriptional regulator [Lawsonibacter sp.]
MRECHGQHTVVRGQNIAGAALYPGYPVGNGRRDPVHAPQASGAVLRTAEKRPQLGKNVVLLRKARGLSQKELACRAHVSAAYLRELEHGCANPTMELLGRIAESLEVSMLVLGALTLPDSAVLDAVHRVRAAAKLEKVSPEDLLVL